MNPDSIISSHFWSLLLGSLLLVGLPVCGWMLWRLHRRGGELREMPAGRQELMAGLALIGALALNAAYVVVFQRGDYFGWSTSLWRLVVRDGLKLVLCAGLCGFLIVRGIGPARFFGLTRLRWQRLLLIGPPLFIAMAPLVMAAYAGSLLVLQSFNFQAHAAPALFWEIAGLSRNASGTLHILGILLIAPVTEEVLYRGYLYPVLKPRLGPIGSALFTAALFAAVHLSVPAFAPLFITSLCLTIAYETTGCLLVPVVMHVLANGANLLLHWPPA